MASSPESKHPTKARTAKAERTRAAIVTAALEEFSERGFMGARLDEIAQRASVAKGTIYIHFRDKEALFEGILQGILLPYSQDLEAKTIERQPDSPTDFFEHYLLPTVRALQADRRVDILRLLISEGPRFPALTEIYYRVIVEPNISKVQRLLKRSVKPEAAELANFPQLVAAPILAGLIWNTLFERFHEIDLEQMMRTHFKLLSTCLQQTGPET